MTENPMVFLVLALGMITGIALTKAFFAVRNAFFAHRERYLQKMRLEKLRQKHERIRGNEA